MTLPTTDTKSPEPASSLAQPTAAASSGGAPSSSSSASAPSGPKKPERRFLFVMALAPFPVAGRAERKFRRCYIDFTDEWKLLEVGTENDQRTGDPLLEPWGTYCKEVQERIAKGIIGPDSLRRILEAAEPTQPSPSEQRRLAVTGHNTKNPAMLAVRWTTEEEAQAYRALQEQSIRGQDKDFLVVQQQKQIVELEARLMRLEAGAAAAATPSPSSSSNAPTTSAAPATAVAAPATPAPATATTPAAETAAGRKSKP